MKLKSCRVQNFRSVLDSGWVDVDDIAVIVGKNESGKTSFLKALWKFNPFQDAPYNIDREWPSGRRKEKSPQKIVSSTRFEFTAEEIAEIEKVHESAKGITGVEMSRNYAGEYTHTFSPQNPSTEHTVTWVVDLLKSRLSSPSKTATDYFMGQYSAHFTTIVKEVRENGGSAHALTKLNEFKAELPSFRHPNSPQQDQSVVLELNNVIVEVVNEINSTPLMRVVDYVHKHLPTFIYMDDYRAFIGSAHLDEVLKHVEADEATPEEETINIIMEMSGLSLKSEVAKGKVNDRQQRNLDMDDASNTLTTLIANNWGQRKYKVEFRADGQHFNTYVKDETDKALIPLEDRSKGFQWFFSFDMRFMYETDGQFKNAIILLDEPGLHLHAAAQGDLLARMKEYAKGNQLIYTTHLPFMIDFKRLDNIYVAEEIPPGGAKIHTNWATADKDARFTLQAALGLSWSQSLFVGQYNLVVEGVDDFWFITTFSALFEEAGQSGLAPELVVTPAGGASKVAYIGTILHGQKLHVAVLLDSDPAGKQAFEQLVHTWILKDKLVLMVGDVVGANPCALEDLFDESYYLSKVNEAYAKERGTKKLTVDAKTAGKRTIVERVEDAFTANGMGEFHKSRVSKRIMLDLGKANLASVDKTTVGNFRKIIDAANALVAKWKKS